MATRTKRGRFKKLKRPFSLESRSRNVIIEHNYAHVNGNTYDREPQHPLLPGSASYSSWKVGRRVIELSVLLNNLRYCAECRLGPVPLTYENIIGELRKGLGGFLYVKCQNNECGFVNRVAYGKTHHIKRKGMPCFSANTKLGTAMIDCVGGHVKVNNVLSTLNIKPIGRNSLQSVQRRSGAFVEAVASTSTNNAAKQAFADEITDIHEEESSHAAKNADSIDDDLGVSLLPDASPSLREKLTTSANTDTPGDMRSESDGFVFETLPHLEKKKSRHAVADREFNGLKSRKKLSSIFRPRTRRGMSCAVDTAWQKRGFDSLTSHTFFMSKAKYGGKVVKTVVSHRTCGTCNWWRRNRKGQPVRKHRCVKDHIGSAKLMESTSGEKGIIELEKSGTPVDIIEGDGDNTLIARLKQNLNMDVKKKFDKNHVMKNFGKSLYALQNEKNIKLGKSTIIHLQKSISYALSKNSGDKDGLEENLKAIIPHNFGDHSLCQPRFCESIRTEGVKYIHRSLPYKCALKDNYLKEKLTAFMAPIIGKVDQLYDLGSSQQCEHANKEVALKAPKSIHYGNSESLDFRVHATAASINEGRHYIAQFLVQHCCLALCTVYIQFYVNEAAGLSPGEHTITYANQCAKKRALGKKKMKLPSVKRRRLILKQERVVNQVALESLEGTSYQSGVGHEIVIDIQQLPEAVPKGIFKPVNIGEEPASYIVVDLETTDLIRNGLFPHITQVAAVKMGSDKSFNQYVRPEIPITDNAERVTGISCSRDGTMMVKGKYVESVGWTQACKEFIKWASNFKNAVLVAHNGRRFDFTVLVDAVSRIGLLCEFCETFRAFVDSLNVFKSAYPSRKTYKQEELARDLLQHTYGAHDAIEDVKCLSLLLSKALSDGNKKFMEQHSFLPKAVFQNMQYNKQKTKNMPSLSVLVYSGVLKRTTAENIAGSGLNLNHLRVIFKRKGEDGLMSSFTTKNSEGQPRVTNAKRTLDAVVPKIVEYFNSE